MYGKPAKTCFKYQVYLYGSEAIWKRTLVWLNNHTYVKNQRENLYGRATITCETTIPKPRV